MKMNKKIILVLVVTILICLSKIEKGASGRSITNMAVEDAGNTKGTEELDSDNGSSLFHGAAENEPYVINTLIQKEADNGSRSSLLYETEENESKIISIPIEEDSAIQTTESLNTDTQKTTSRIITNELCVGVAKEIFDATNAERAKEGIPPLVWDDELAKPAAIRAEEIIFNFSHIREDGTKCYALSDLIWGENIAKGPHANGAEFVEHWMASEGHKKNILQTKYKTIGVGVTCTEQGDTAVQLFGIDAAE